MAIDTGYRLSLEEIIFLSASLTQAKVIYGLRNRPMLDEPQEDRWKRIEKGLFDKQVIQERDGKPTLCSDVLGQMVHTVSHPKALVAVRPYDGDGPLTRAHPPLTRFYIRGMFAVAVENDVYAEGHYTLRAYDDNRKVNERLEGLIGFDGPPAAPEEGWHVSMGAQEMAGVAEAIQGKDQESACAMLAGSGFPMEKASDLCAALAAGQRKHLASYVIYAFDPQYGDDGRRMAQEVLVYGGERHMWKIMATEGAVDVSIASKGTVRSDFQAISGIMNFV